MAYIQIIFSDSEVKKNCHNVCFIQKIIKNQFTLVTESKNLKMCWYLFQYM